MKRTDTRGPRAAGGVPVPHPRGNCIYALVRHSGIEGLLKQWAEKHACRIWWGDPESSSDLVAISSFVIVVDRRLLGRANWDFFVDFTREVNDSEEVIVDGELIDCRDDTVCILVDDIDNWALPRLPYVMRLSPNSPDMNERWLEIGMDLAWLQAQKAQTEAPDRIVVQGRDSVG